MVNNKINDLDAADHQNIKFVIDVADGEYEDIISYVKSCQVYVKLCDMIEEQTSQPVGSPQSVYTFDSILSHEGPLKPTDCFAIQRVEVQCADQVV